MSSYPTPLTPDAIQTLAQAATIQMVPLFAASPNPPGAVRIGWQTLGQPFQQVSQDVAYVRCYEVDDPYNRVRDVSYDQTPEVYTKVTNYTRVWECAWDVYGPNSFDNCRLIRTRLFDQDIHDLFAALNLYLVTDPSAPTRVPELFQGQWWERTDFKARFNEFVTETYNTGYVESATWSLETVAGIPAGQGSAAGDPAYLIVPPPLIPNFSGETFPAGPINGVNTVFTLMAPPNPVNSLQVFLNGVLQIANQNYTVSGVFLTMSSPPSGPTEDSGGDILVAIFRY